MIPAPLQLRFAVGFALAHGVFLIVCFGIFLAVDRFVSFEWACGAVVAFLYFCFLTKTWECGVLKLIPMAWHLKRIKESLPPEVVEDLDKRAGEIYQLHKEKMAGRTDGGAS